MVTLVVVVLGVAISAVVAWILGLIVYGALPGTVVPRPATGEEGWLSPIKVALTVAAGIGGAVALVVAYRKQRQAERQEHRDVAAETRAIAAAAREVDRAFRDRYGVAVEQLGHPNATVRLAGVYALANLADAWTEQRQQCVDVLCAHLRLPWDHDPTDLLATKQTQKVEGETTTTLTYTDHRGEREVRETILRVIGAHLQPDARRAASDESWSTLTLNFQGAWLPDLHWDRCTIPRVSFAEATFIGAADFMEARFSGYAMFAAARFTDYGIFGWSTFTDLAAFGHATFDVGAGFGQATFNGDAKFDLTKFQEGANFEQARFAGKAGFYKATFASYASFVTAVFKSDVDFHQAVFSGQVTALGTVFDAGADFTEAQFAGDAYFLDSRFSEGVPPEIGDAIRRYPPFPD